MRRDPDLDGVSIYVPGDQVEHIGSAEWWALADTVQRQARIAFGVGREHIEVRAIPARLDGVCVQAVVDFRDVPRRGRRHHLVFAANPVDFTRWRERSGVHWQLAVEADRRFRWLGLEPSQVALVYLPGWGMNQEIGEEALAFAAQCKAAGSPVVRAHQSAPCTCSLPWPRMTQAGIAHGPGCAAY